MDGNGVKQDYGEAVRWTRLAAEADHPVAQNNMGYLYENGYGVPADIDTATGWFKLSAAQGYELAINALKRINASRRPGNKSGKVKNK